MWDTNQGRVALNALLFTPLLYCPLAVKGRAHPGTGGAHIQTLRWARERLNPKISIQPNESSS